MSTDGLAFVLGPDVGCLRFSAGESRTINADEWREALVLVQEGTLEVRCSAGETARFATGSVLCLDRVPAGSVSAGADGAVVLVKHRRGSTAMSTPTDTATTEPSWEPVTR